MYLQQEPLSSTAELEPHKASKVHYDWLIPFELATSVGLLNGLDDQPTPLQQLKKAHDAAKKAFNEYKQEMEGARDKLEVKGTDMGHPNSPNGPLKSRRQLKS